MALRLTPFAAAIIGICAAKPRFAEHEEIADQENRLYSHEKKLVVKNLSYHFMTGKGASEMDWNSFGLMFHADLDVSSGYVGTAFFLKQNKDDFIALNPRVYAQAGSTVVFSLTVPFYTLSVSFNLPLYRFTAIDY